MTADDLTRLRDEFNEILAEHATWGFDDTTTDAICLCGEPVLTDGRITHRAHVASVLASSPTVAALIDRVERAERQVRHNDELRMGVEKVLDLALGTEPVDGAGEGLVSDVHLLAIRYTEALDRAERAERERDLLQTEVNTWIENDQISFARATRLDDEITALRAAVEGKADEWEERAMTCCSLTCKNCGARYIDPDELRGLLTEGADDGQ